MAFRDQLIRCGACGTEFVFTVREQRRRVELGLPADPPAFCPDCRGADVRLAEAEAAAPPARTNGDSPPGERNRDRVGRSSPEARGRDRARPRSDRPRSDGQPASRRFDDRDRDRRGSDSGPKGRDERRRPRERQTELRIRHVGTVKWFNNQKGYGFVAQEDGGEVFIHLSSMLDQNIRSIEIGTPVEFEIEHTTRGPQAVDVVPLA